MFRYTKPQIVLHWAVVLLLIVQYLWNEPMGHAFRDWIRGGDKVLSTGAFAHLVVGVAVLAIGLWRLALRRSAPSAPHGAGLLDPIAALIHWLLYALLIAIPVAGLVAWFGGSRGAGEFHEILTNVLLALAGLHVVAALYHQFVLKDGLLRRMSLR